MSLNDSHGCSRCKLPGQELYEEFEVRGKKYVQYDYRDYDGKLFSTVETSLEKARKAKNTWVDNKFLKLN